MVYMYHSFLIHASADQHLGCFHVLAIINSAAINIWVHMCPSHPEPPSHLLRHPVSLGCPRAPASSALLHASNLHWSST